MGMADGRSCGHRTPGKRCSLTPNSTLLFVKHFTYYLLKLTAGICAGCGTTVTLTLHVRKREPHKNWPYFLVLLQISNISLFLLNLSVLHFSKSLDSGREYIVLGQEILD